MFHGTMRLFAKKPDPRNPREMVLGDLFFCAACRGHPHLTVAPILGGKIIICTPCMMLWYDTGETDPARLGAESLRRHACGKWPWTGTFR